MQKQLKNKSEPLGLVDIFKEITTASFIEICVSMLTTCGNSCFIKSNISVFRKIWGSGVFDWDTIYSVSKCQSLFFFFFFFFFEKRSSAELAQRAVNFKVSRYLG